MLSARLDGPMKNLLLLALTPHNLDELKKGHPLTVNLNEFFAEIKQKCDLGIAFTPDEVWVEEQVQNGGDIIRALQESQLRPEPEPAVYPMTGTLCSVCLEPQFESPGGTICSNGHGGAPPVLMQPKQ
jgi:hypothetical protein